MSYPAQNTNTEFEALIHEVKKLRHDLSQIRNMVTKGDMVDNAIVAALRFSESRLTFEFSNQRYNELFVEIIEK